MEKFTCHVCGYQNLDSPPWGEDGITPNYDGCRCCGVEYGNDDINEIAYYQYKEEWLSAGGEWLMKNERPPNWDMVRQLENIKKIQEKYLPYYLRGKL